jgi:hypothetical protein
MFPKNVLERDVGKRNKKHAGVAKLAISHIS